MIQNNNDTIGRFDEMIEDDGKSPLFFSLSSLLYLSRPKHPRDCEPDPSRPISDIHYLRQISNVLSKCAFSKTYYQLIAT